MNDRLTYSSPGRHQEWPQVLPLLMLLLAAVAMIPVSGLQTPSSDADLRGLSLPMSSLAFILLLTQSGVLLRSTLPEKASPPLKAFAATCGIGIPFFYVLGILDNMHSPFLSLTGAALMLSSWCFQLSPRTYPLMWAVASGLTAGMACSISPGCFSGALALLFFTLFQKEPSWNIKAQCTLAWIAALLCGLVPALNGGGFLPLYGQQMFDPEFVRAGVVAVSEHISIWTWLFAGFGLLIAILQRQKIILGLIVPFFILRLLLAGFSSLQVWEIDSTLLLPFAWLTAYGLLRLLRGIEQGVRRVHPERAKKIPVIATCVFLAAFLLKIVDLYSSAS